MAYISKGLTLSYKTSEAGSYTELTDLQEIPALNGSVDSIEITTLGDAAHTYTNGLISYGDNLAFSFIYNPTQFTTLNALTGVVYWQVGIPDGDNGAVGTTASFTGSCRVEFDGKGTGAALTYTLNIKPNSEMVFA